jgi:hypothetical protein
MRNQIVIEGIKPTFAAAGGDRQRGLFLRLGFIYDGCRFLYCWSRSRLLLYVSFGFRGRFLLRSTAALLGRCGCGCGSE